MLIRVASQMMPCRRNSDNYIRMMFSYPTKTKKRSFLLLFIQCAQYFIDTFINTNFKLVPLQIMRIIVMIIPVFNIKCQYIHINTVLTDGTEDSNI